MKQRAYTLLLLFLFVTWTVVLFYLNTENQILKEEKIFYLETIEELQLENYNVNITLEEKKVENSVLKEELDRLENIVEFESIARSLPKPTPVPTATPQPKPNYDSSQTNLELLSRIIYCEAGGEGENDQLAVGQVVLNRMNKYDMTLKETVYQRLKNGTYVFSPVASSSYSTRTYSAESENIARRLLNGEKFDPVGNALYFCTIASYNSKGWHYQYVSSGDGHITYKTNTTVYIR